jgi:hypothetical protein
MPHSYFPEAKYDFLRFLAPWCLGGESAKATAKVQRHEDPLRWLLKNKIVPHPSYRLSFSSSNHNSGLLAAKF